MAEGEVVGYRFGPGEMLCATRELRVAGRVVPVEPQVFDLILCLLRARSGRVA